MDNSAFLNIQDLDDEARKELNTFIDFLTFKSKIRHKKDKAPHKKNKSFTALRIDTTRFKFNREEANER